MRTIKTEKDIQKTGELVRLNQKGITFNATVLNPNGLGIEKPSYCVSIRGINQLTGLSETTLNRYVAKYKAQAISKNKNKLGILTPEGKSFPLVTIEYNCSRYGKFLELRNLEALCLSLLALPLRISKEIIEEIEAFLIWFDPDEIYKTYFGQHSQTRLISGYLFYDNNLRFLDSPFLDLFHDKNCRKYLLWLEKKGLDKLQQYRRLNWIFVQIFNKTTTELKEYLGYPQESKIKINNLLSPLGKKIFTSLINQIVNNKTEKDLEVIHHQAIWAIRDKFFMSNNLSLIDVANYC